jgi:meiotic recombination protein DMC1
MACFRVDFVGRGELSERQQKLGQFLQKLNHIANGMLFSLHFARTAHADVQ